MTTVAVLGTGTMGAPIARNLAQAGFEVHAWNRSRDKAEPLTQDGITVHDEAAEAVPGAELVLTMLTNGDAVRAVVTDEGALEAMPAGATWIQLSTVGVRAADEFAPLAAERGVAYVDAPVSGTKEPAEQGKLVVLASGPEDARERCAPVFDAIGQKTIWLGEAGAGSRMKMVVNTWLLALVEGLAESIALAEGLELDPAKFLEVIDGGPLFAPYAKVKGGAMIEGAFDPSFALKHAAKDARLAAEAARDAGLRLPLLATIGDQMSRGVDDGHGD